MATLNPIPLGLRPSPGANLERLRAGRGHGIDEVAGRCAQRHRPEEEF